MQHDTLEGFLAVERAHRYAALVSKPTKFRVHETTRVLNAGARRDRIEFLRRQPHPGPID